MLFFPHCVLVQAWTTRKRRNIVHSRRKYPVWKSSLQSLRKSAPSWMTRSKTNIRHFTKERRKGTSWGIRIWYLLSHQLNQTWVRAQFICSAVKCPHQGLFLLTRLEERNIQVLYESKLRRKNQVLASRSNKLKRFGDHVPDLLGAIAEAYATGRFLKRPVGPIGDFLFLVFCWLDFQSALLST